LANGGITLCCHAVKERVVDVVVFEPVDRQFQTAITGVGRALLKGEIARDDVGDIDRAHQGHSGQCHGHEHDERDHERDAALAGTVRRRPGAQAGQSAV
jgi:hypothetical protein